jgi:hypothetical protein
MTLCYTRSTYDGVSHQLSVHSQGSGADRLGDILGRRTWLVAQHSGDSDGCKTIDVPGSTSTAANGTARTRLRRV